MFRNTLWLLSCTLLVMLNMAMLPLGGCRTTQPGRSRSHQNLATLARAAEAARDSQVSALEAFRGGAERLDAALAASDSSVGALSRALAGDLLRVEGRESAVRALDGKLDRTAAELFAQWQQELARMSSPALRRESGLSLERTRAAYRQLQPVLQTAERQMVAPLQSFRDKVLLLKRTPTRQSLELVRAEQPAFLASLEALESAVGAAVEAASVFLAALPAESP